MGSDIRSGPLAGTTIVEFGQYIAVPGAAQMLADQGADVIKVEAPRGEAARHVPGYGPAMIASYNRGKRMVALDLRTDEGQRDARALALSADVVMSNARPGVMERLGLSPEDLMAERSDLVCLSLTGFGAEGPLRNRPGLDIAAQAESGQMWVTGEADGPPQRVGFPLVDAATSYVIAQAITAALLDRFRTGSGADIKISLWDVAIHMQASNWMEYSLTGQAPVRKGNGHPSAAPAAEVIEVADGHIVLSAYADAHWRTLCTLLEVEHLLDDPRMATSDGRVAHRPEMTTVLSAALRHRTRAECVALLAGGGIVIGAILEYPEVRDVRGDGPGSPFLRADPREDGVAPWYIGPPVTWGAMAPDSRPPRPVGADTETVLAGLTTPAPRQ